MEKKSTKGCLKAGADKFAQKVRHIFNRVTIHWNKLSLEMVDFSFCFQIKSCCSPTKLISNETKYWDLWGSSWKMCDVKIKLNDLMEFSELVNLAANACPFFFPSYPSCLFPWFLAVLYMHIGAQTPFFVCFSGFWHNSVDLEPHGVWA